MESSESLHVAADLNAWFQDVRRAMEKGVVGIAPEGPHRDAIVLDALQRNARLILDAPLDEEGFLYSPVCFFLVAACRRLRLQLGEGHWRAAIESLRGLRTQLEEARAVSSSVGLDLGTPAKFFKQELEQAIQNAGLGGRPSYLEREDREIALGLAVNWALRFLPAYASECHRLPTTDRRDLSWIGALVDPGSRIESPVSRRGSA